MTRLKELLFYNELGLSCMRRFVPLIIIWCNGHTNNSMIYNVIIQKLRIHKYMNKIWIDKISMCYIGSCNIPHVGQNTNVTHYWYDIQCKAFGFICNRNQEHIITSTITRVDAILDSNLLICIDNDVAYVGSVNNRPKVWTIHSPDLEWVHYSYLIAT